MIYKSRCTSPISYLWKQKWWNGGFHTFAHIMRRQESLEKNTGKGWRQQEKRKTKYKMDWPSKRTHRLEFTRAEQLKKGHFGDHSFIGCRYIRGNVMAHVKNNNTVLQIGIGRTCHKSVLNYVNPFQGLLGTEQSLAIYHSILLGLYSLPEATQAGLSLSLSLSLWKNSGEIKLATSSSFTWVPNSVSSPVRQV